MGMIINPYLVQPSGPSYGTLTTAWIAATGETDTTILGALNTLESDLTTYGLTSKMKALYPFVGGTSTKHSYNFMNTSQYQVTWYGGVTHNSNGVTGNGTNGYGNTFLKSITAGLSKDDCSLSVYSRTSAASGASSPYDIGSGDNLGANLFDIAVRRNANQSIFDVGNATPNRISQFISDGSGLFNGSANGSNLYYYRNGSLLGSSTQSSSNNILDKNVYVLGFNENDTNTYYSDRNLALASIGKYLTPTESANLYTAVQTFQTTLSRQV